MGGSVVPGARSRVSSAVKLPSEGHAASSVSPKGIQHRHAPWASGAFTTNGAASSRCEKRTVHAASHGSGQSVPWALASCSCSVRLAV